MHNTQKTKGNANNIKTSKNLLQSKLQIFNEVLKTSKSSIVFI